MIRVILLPLAVAEDFNADGTVDLYAASRYRDIASSYVANRTTKSLPLTIDSQAPRHRVLTMH